MNMSDEELYHCNMSAALDWAADALSVLMTLRHLSPEADRLVDSAPSIVHRTMIERTAELARIDGLLRHHARLWHEENGE